MSRSKKTTTPSKEIPDAANTKILELESELERTKTELENELNRTQTEEVRRTVEMDKLARQKTAKEQETEELKELADQQTELARQRDEENQRLVAQIAELRLRNMRNSSLNLNTPQVLPPIPHAPTYLSATSTPSGIWGMPETAIQGNTAARSLGPDLQDEGLQGEEEKGPMSAEKALEALEKFGGSLFGGNDGHIPPSFSSAHSAFLKHLSTAPDGPFDPVTLAQHMTTAISLFFGTELNSNDFEKFSCEQISVALVAQKLTLLHAMHGVIGRGKDEEKSKGITGGDAIWMSPILAAQRKGSGGQKGLALSNDLCMGLDRPSPTEQPATYKIVAEVSAVAVVAAVEVVAVSAMTSVVARLSHQRSPTASIKSRSTLMARRRRTGRQSRTSLPGSAGYNMSVSLHLRITST